MKRDGTSISQRIARALLMLISMSAAFTSYARVGGAGGHGGGGGGFGHGGGGGGGFYVGGGGLSSPVVIIIIIVVVIYYVYSKRGNSGGGEAGGPGRPIPQQPFPEGLDPQKVAGSFMSIQDAWQQQDLTNVRKWLSDGMYQRLTTQFNMMKILAQRNTLGNIRINNIAAADAKIDGQYQAAVVAISFTMDDSFTSTKYPQFNERYDGDTDTEFWTFIKRTDSDSEKNLYDNNNCPNCGAPFEVKMGEISRCSNCNTLTNSAAYDWVLCEITQQADYNPDAYLPGLREIAVLEGMMKNDPFFSKERMEDMASNIFMQIMNVMTGNDKKRLTRFADEQTTNAILQQMQGVKPFVFDRLFLNRAELVGFSEDADVVKIYFELTATYRRVAIGDKLQMLDGDFVTRDCKLELSRNRQVLDKAAKGETVYSYECSTCGAPYTDTTQDHCTYCDAPVVDKKRNWVLTGLGWAG